MRYAISDAQFLEELRVNAFINQVQGYPVGMRRMAFRPIIVTFPGKGGSKFNREQTLNTPAYTFTDEQKRALLAEQEAAI